jgi:hypothetical protein
VQMLQDASDTGDELRTVLRRHGNGEVSAGAAPPLMKKRYPGNRNGRSSEVTRDA